MAANKIYIDVIIDDKGTTKRVAIDAAKLGANLDKTGTSSNKVGHIMKGISKQSSNTTKNFSKMSEGITGGLVPAYATLAANIFALSAAFNFFKKQADLSILRESQISYAQSTGTAIGTLTTSLQQASGNMLTFKASAEAAAIGMAKGFTPEQMESLAIGARKVSAALGRDFEDAFDRLVRGVSKAEPELLDELGITLRLANATKRYGDQIGKNAKELTEYERSQAVMVEVQRQLNEQFGDQALQANPFQQLLVTMDDMINKVMEGVLPVFSAIADTINRSAGAAIAVFGLIALSILKSIPAVANFSQNIDNWITAQTEGFEDAKKALEDYKQEILDADKAAELSSGKGRKKAGEMVKGGNKSKVLERFSTGKMKGADEHNLKKALKGAESQLDAHGKITSGIFSGYAKKDVAIIKKSLGQSDGHFKKFFKTKIRGFKKLSLGAKREFARIKKYSKAMLGGIGKAAGAMGKMMGKAMAFAGWVGMLMMVWNAFKTLQGKIYDVAIAFLTFVDKMLNSGIGKMVREGIGAVVKALGSVVDFVTEKLGNVAKFILGIYSKILGFIEKIPGAIGEGAGSAKEFLDAQIETNKLLQGTNLAQYGEDMMAAAGATSDLAGSFAESDLGKWTLSIQETAQAANEAESAFNSWKQLMGTMGTDLKAMEEGIAATTNAFDAGANIATYLGTLNLGNALQKASDMADKSGNQGYLDTMLENLATSTLPQVTEALKKYKDGDYTITELIEDLQASANAGSRATSGETAFTNQIESLEEALRNPGDLDALNLALDRSNSSMEQVTAAMEDLNEVTDIQNRLNEASGGSFLELKTRVEDMINSQQRLKLEEIERNKRQETFARKGNLVAKYLKEQLGWEEKQAAVEAKRLEISRLQLAVDRVASLQPAELARKERELKIAQAELDRLQVARDNYAEDISDLNKIRQTTVDQLGSGLASAFDAIVMGTKSVKEAFKDMAMGILQSLSRVISQMMATQMMMAMMGGIQGGFSTTRLDATQSNLMAGIGQTAPIGSMGPLGGNRKGGIVKPPDAYGAGGIARGNNVGGYPAILHGTEAVVPLPDGKSIPVSMQGGASNNIVVNISADGQTSTEGADLEGAGQAIAAAVQAELQNQKRSGGMLNPYGVA